MISTIVELVGLAVIVTAVFLLAGFAWSVLAAGVVLVVVGVAADRAR